MKRLRKGKHMGDPERPPEPAGGQDDGPPDPRLVRLATFKFLHDLGERRDAVPLPDDIEDRRAALEAVLARSMDDGDGAP